MPTSGPSESAIIGPGGWRDLGLATRLTAGPARARPSPPFVLLDDARGGGDAMLFADPQDVLIAHSPDQVRPTLAWARKAIASGYYVAGYLSYEAGLALHPRLGDLPVSDAGIPLAWLGVFTRPCTIPVAAFTSSLPTALLEPRPGCSFAEYAARVERSLDLIRAGDVYQINLTFQNQLALDNPWASYTALRTAQKAGWGAVVATGDDLFISCSPELFFALDADARITARPMKGTSARHQDPREDRRAAETLRMSAKDRSENLMIVDLLRNDIGRVARPGSIRVPRLFEIESYSTVHQMTSTVLGELATGHDLIDLLIASFPSGSVTGTPKVRAMEIIATLEGQPRGIYTGSIGFMTPGGAGAFNVAIRTIATRAGSGTATMGLGSAIVADSLPEQEWRECLMKGAFVRRPLQPAIFP